MLSIESVALELVRLLAPVLESIGRRDRPLEDQLRRALSSVILNIAEGSWGSCENNSYIRPPVHFSRSVPRTPK